MPAHERVRCVLQGATSASTGSDASLADTTTLLRGIAALYGDGLDFQVAASSSESQAAGAQNGHGDSACTATITTSDVDGEQPDKVVVLHGQPAIIQYMKTLLETHLQSQDNTAKSSSSPTETYNPIRIFVSGDRSQVGKSTVCLGLVGALLRHGFAPEDVAYIKPATQCEAPQLVATFCRQQRVACCDIGPIVFYSGFTREFLKGNTEPPEALLAKAKAKVDEIGRGKKIVVVDGVGYPAVGSICGVSNAAVASAVQAPVVLVGKRGVGDAVDSFNLNASFFESQGVRVLGALFNRLPIEGYYSLKNCRESVTAYFDQFQPHKRVYGFIPEMEQVDADDAGHEASVEPAENSCDGDGGDTGQEIVRMTPQEARQAALVIDTFYEHVDLTQLLQDAEQHQSFAESRAIQAVGPTKRLRVGSAGVSDAGILKRSRAEIQAAAKASGAASS